MTDDGSNGDWGHSHDTAAPDRAALYHEWDAYQPITQFGPMPDGLELFCKEHGVTPAGLGAVGARWLLEGGRLVLAYLFPDAVKYRTVKVPTKRWVSPAGATFKHLKMIPSWNNDTEHPVKGVLVVEGETDAACCHQWHKNYVVAVMPSGALTFTESMAAQLNAFDVPVLVGLDNDEAGDKGADVILSMVPKARRVRAPYGNDWCESRLDSRWDEAWDPLENAIEPERTVFSLREVATVDLGTYEDNNWFEHDVLPRGGSCIIHAPQKSLKSVIMLDMIRALSTGTSFACEWAYNNYTKTMDSVGGYQFAGPAPAKVLLFQMEIRPEGFQRRVQGWLDQMPDEHKDAFMDNTFVHKIVDGELPRIKIGSKDFRATVLRAIDTAQANVVAFDPLQRLTGSADLNQANELEALLDFFAELQNAGITVLACHHNNKASGATARGAHAMTGSQRFAADADSICSVWHSDECGSDDNEELRKRRNFTWTLRNGAAIGRSITVKPAQNSELMYVTFGPLLTSETNAVENGDPSIV